MRKNSPLLFKLFLILCSLSVQVSTHAQNIPQVGQTYTLEIANWNLEWFGKTTPGFGPSDDVKQQALVLKTIQSADIDIWALCEVSEKKAFDSMMLKLPKYQSVLANYLPEQKTALLFSKNLFTFLDSKLLGTENKDSFSTLRFPLEVRLLPKNNIGIDTLRIIVLHLKANTGTDSAKMVAYNSRKRSADWLKMYLNSLPKNNFSMVVGDWNDDLDFSIFNNLPSPFVKLQSAGFNYQFLTKKFTDNGKGTTTGYPDPIDHQLASSSLALKHKTDSSFVWQIEQFISNYASTCSDHYPVYSIFNTYGLGVNNEINIKQVSLFPNPATKTISLGNVGLNQEIIIYNSLGQIVFERCGLEKNEIDISQWEKGLYFVRVKTNEHEQILEFIVE